jgi:hypothetical protein
LPSSSGGTLESGVDRRHHDVARGPVPRWRIICGIRLWDSLADHGRRQCCHIDKYGRPVVLASTDRERRAGPSFDGESHHRFVDAADLLDIEGAVGQLFAVEAEQQVENAEDAAVGHGGGRGRIGQRVLPLQERKRCRIEQLSAAPANPACRVTAMDESEKRQQTRPCAAPLVHRIGMMRGIVEQARVEGADAIALVIKRPRVAVSARWDEVAILRIEEEHEPKEDGQQPFLEVSGTARRQGLDPTRGSRMEATQQLMQCAQHLRGELCRYFGLRIPAGFQERHQPAVGGIIVQPE